jgi:diguanylate cyclase (GGDEF)-like protein
LNFLIYSSSDESVLLSDIHNFTVVDEINSVFKVINQEIVDIILVFEQDISCINLLIQKVNNLHVKPVIINVNESRQIPIPNVHNATKSSLPYILPYIIEIAEVNYKRRVLLEDLNRLGEFFSNLRTDEYSETQFMNQVLTQLDLILAHQHDYSVETIQSFLYQRSLDDISIIRAASGSFSALVNTQLPESYELNDEICVSVKSGVARISIPFKWNGENVGGYYVETALSKDNQVFVHDLHCLISSFMGSTGIYDLVSVDTTTRLLTRRFLLQRLYEELKSSYRANHELTILMMDLDKFKQINDTKGHPAGDKILREIGILLREAARESDIVGRFGGDEFIAVLPETGVDGGCMLAYRIRELIRLMGAEHPLSVNGLDISIGVCGISCQDYNGKHKMTHENFQSAMNSLISIADDAMYMAKQSVYDKVKSHDAVSWKELVAGEKIK